MRRIVACLALITIALIGSGTFSSGWAAGFDGPDLAPAAQSLSLSAGASTETVPSPAPHLGHEGFAITPPAVLDGPETCHCTGPDGSAKAGCGGPMMAGPTASQSLPPPFVVHVIAGPSGTLAGLSLLPDPPPPKRA